MLGHASGALWPWGGQPRFQKKRWHKRRGVGWSPEPRQRSGEAEERGQAPGGRRERGERRSFPARPSLARSAAPWSRPSPPAPWKRGAERSARAPWGAPHSGPRCCCRRCCCCFCCESRRAAASQVGPEAGQLRQLATGDPSLGTKGGAGGAFVCAELVFRRPREEVTRSRARIWALGGESRPAAHRRAPSRRREPVYPLRLRFQGTNETHVGVGGYGEKFGRGLVSHHPEFCLSYGCSRPRPRGLAAFPGRNPYPLPLEVPGHPVGLQGTSHGRATLVNSTGGPLPHPPTPLAGDSEKVCAAR